MTIMTNMVFHVKISNISYDHYKNMALHMRISTISQKSITNPESTTTPNLITGISLFLQI